MKPEDRHPIPNLTFPELCGLASLANVDPRTMARVLRGETVKGDAGVRCARALATAGIKVVPAPKAGGPRG